MMWPCRVAGVCKLLGVLLSLLPALRAASARGDTPSIGMANHSRMRCVASVPQLPWLTSSSPPTPSVTSVS